MKDAPARKPTLVCCAKHPVNFAMFEPVYRRLRETNEFDLLISTGRYRRRPILGWIGPKARELTNENVLSAFDISPEHLGRTSCHDKREYDLYVSSNGDMKMRPPNARTSVQIFHGVSFRNFAINKNLLKFDKLFFPGPYHIRQFIRRGLLTEGDPRIELMGMPKLDCLVDGSIRREQVLASLKLDPSRPTVLWCPTGARFNSFEKYGKAAVDAVDQAGCNLILKLHDHPHLEKGRTTDDVMREAMAILGPNAKLAGHPNVAPLLVAADLLISDASSVAYEYTILDRPIVFLDVPELLDQRSASDNSAMDLETHGRKCGLIVSNANDLAEAIRTELENPETHSVQRRATATDIFHEPGTATTRMIARLKELAMQVPERTVSA